ncbi:MAG: flagellar M-ring protein FliF [Chloroflexota bacterium]|nr:MAG: flagellar M-ring protein FliF [Chloroflexota bacterium]
MAALVAQLRSTWNQLSPSQRVILSAGMALIVIVTVAVAWWSSRTDYAYAFTNLSEESAAQVTAKLRDDKTPYKLADGGRSIMVPATEVYDIRLRLASQNLPQGKGIGFEVFDKMNFSMTDSLQKINYQRALEGELARTISRLQPVSDARVHLALPEKALFTRDQKDVTAAVVLTLKSGQQLDSGQIKAITYLVSSSVEGLKPQNLTIVDTDGRALTSGGNSDRAGDATVSAAARDQQRSYEQAIESNVESMLAKVVGPGKVTAKASAVFNWDRVETQKETYSPKPDQAAVVSSHEILESNGQGGSTPSGVPGLSSNLPTYQQVLTTTNGVYQRQDITKNYELNKSTEHIVTAPGQLKKLSVAVMLSQSSLPAGLDEVRIRELVSAAVGLDSARGDTVTVLSAPFSETQATSGSSPQPTMLEQYDPYLRYLPVAAMILGPVLLLLVLRSVLNRSAKAFPAPVESIMLPAGIHGGQSGLGNLGNLDLGGLDQRALDAHFDGEADLPRLPQGEAMMRHVDNMARNNPAALGRLIKTWLEDDERR